MIPPLRGRTGTGRLRPLCAVGVTPTDPPVMLKRPVTDAVLVNREGFSFQIVSIPLGFVSIAVAIVVTATNPLASAILWGAGILDEIGSFASFFLD